MSTIHALLNRTQDHHQEQDGEQESYDRAEEIAHDVARSMTSTPTPAPNPALNPAPISTKTDTSSTYSTATFRPSPRPKPKQKRLLASSITSVSDIHFRRFVSTSPTPSPTTPTATPTPSRATSPSPTPSLVYSPNAMQIPFPPQSPRKRIIKDAPIYTRGPTRGMVRYPPHVYGGDFVLSSSNADEEGEGDAVVKDDDTTAAGTPTRSGRGDMAGAKGRGEGIEEGILLRDYHDEYQVFPKDDEIGDFPRCIPYNSERRIFADKTGRDFFEVFQYEFKVPGREEKTYTMLWDYNIGLVRTTPLFKCCGFSKTTPAKMLNRNIGLREICHSITGGALVAQGYWMPYEAAKAVAATFCWSIRYALTPVFGVDFIDMCIPPESDRFQIMLIDPKITKLCTEQAQEYLKLEMDNPTVRPGPTSGLPSPRTPNTPVFPRAVVGPVSARFKAVNARAGNGGGTSSGYSSEASQEDAYAMSPSSSVGPVFRNVWTRGNMPRSMPRVALFEDPVSPKTRQGVRGKMRREREDDEDYEERVKSSSKRGSPTAGSRRERKEDLIRMEVDGEGEYDGDASDMDVDQIKVGGWVGSLRYHGGREEGKRKMKQAEDKPKNRFGANDAAEVLMSLWGVRKVPERRASA